MAKSNKKSLGWRGRIVGVMGLVMAIVCLPSAVILLFGMMPALVAMIFDRSKGARGLTVGAMNLAGCLPFLIQLWTKGNTFQLSLNIIANPQTIIIIYCAAAIGYMIDWALTGIVASLMVQKGQKRRRDILKRQEILAQRWGQEVTGEIPLDAFGFPVSDQKNG